MVLGVVGCCVVVVEFYVRIFFWNLVVIGELYLVEINGKIWEENYIGDIVILDMDNDVLVNYSIGK